MLIARRERLEMLVLITFFLIALADEFDMFAEPSVFYYDSTSIVIPQWIILLDRTPRRKL